MKKLIIIAVLLLGVCAMGQQSIKPVSYVIPNQGRVSVCIPLIKKTKAIQTTAFWCEFKGFVNFEELPFKKF